jgi:sugar phosphate isomerase/epimerase
MIDRRNLLQAGAAVLATASAGRALAQGAAPAAAAPRFYLDACSRNLQWIRNPAELAGAVQELGLSSIDLNVAAYPGHVDPARATIDLPAFVAAMKAGGVETRAITTPLDGADAPGAEALLAAAAKAGVKYYTWGGVAWDERQPYAAQVEALKARFTKLAKLNAKYGLKGLYQPRGDGAGALFADLLPVMQTLDPKLMGFRYDTAALLQVRPELTVRHLRMAGPYIGGLALNDAAVDLEFPQWEQGRFTDSPEILTRPHGGGDNLGDAGGDWAAYGGGGRPLPYRFRAKPTGTGMIDLIRIGETLKEIGFDGPAEVQAFYDLGGAEAGADKIVYPRQEVIGRLKRDRITVEQAFRAPFNLKVARPAFLERRDASSARPAPAANGPPSE